jgi:hypothetical protein
VLLAVCHLQQQVRAPADLSGREADADAGEVRIDLVAERL